MAYVVFLFRSSQIDPNPRVIKICINNSVIQS